MARPAARAMMRMSGRGTSKAGTRDQGLETRTDLKNGYTDRMNKMNRIRALSSHLVHPVHPARGRGFTLVEMLVVLLIVGLLAGLVSIVARPDERALLRSEERRVGKECRSRWRG